MKETILVVDDNTDILTQCSEGLLRKGFNVVTASSGEQALEILSECPADVLITDVNMPGMSGQELLGYTMKLYPGMSVLVITAYATLPMAVDAMNMGAQAFLLKPFGIEDLHRTVKNLLDRNKLRQNNAEIKALQILSDMDLSITSMKRIEEAAGLIVSKSIKAGKGDRAIFLLREGNEFKVAADHGLKNGVKKVIDIDKFIAIQMAEAHKGTVRYDDDSPMTRMMITLLGEEVGETIVTPLLHEEKLAVLLVGRYKNSEPFHNTDIAAVRVIANHIWSVICLTRS